MRYKNLITTVILAISLSVALAQNDNITVTRGPGGTIQTELGYGITLNRSSTLEREWITVNDTTLPVQFAQTPIGITTEYSSDNRAYRYTTTFHFDVAEPLSAIEFRFILFDIWGDHVGNLNLTEIVDMTPGQRSASGTWRVRSENDAAHFYASIAYVSRIRTSAGQVIEVDTGPALYEAQQYSASFTSSDLDVEE